MTQPPVTALPVVDHIRNPQDSDADAVRAFLAALSPSAQHNRFFTRLGSVSPSLVRQLITATPNRQYLIVVRGPEVIGHGMVAVTSGGGVELAVVVAEQHRQRGVGNRLMHSLIELAERAGADRLVFEVLSENQLMLDWLRRLFPGARFEPDGSAVTCSVPLRPAANPLRAA